MIDLLVIGGGPTGLATAILATRVGFSTTVVEAREGPLDKACGEGLMPSAVAALHAMGVRPPGRAFHGIRYVDGPRWAEGRFRAGPGLGVRRTRLHQALSTRADALGVTRLHARAGVPQQGADWVEAAGVRARWLVAADGLHSPVRRALGVALPPRVPARYGLRRHFCVSPWSDVVEVHWAADAEAYVTPVTDDIVGVAVLFSGRGGYDDWLCRFPALRERLAGASVASSVRGAGPFEQRVTRRRVGRVFLAGDAAGYVDPLTGEGVNLGIAAGAALVQLLRDGHPEAYDAMWRRLTLQHRALTHGLLWAARRPRMRRRIVPAAGRLPAVFGAALDQLS
ncbi:MAG: NAD(P)/FAD-dependent oxidoreductase [Actinomycetota bacterium]|nr:NAD(P)/FAD-dependent oxidoreductase [Actinomycetota bacterium]